ncbi:ABC transporter permease [Terrilactibacillus laevilacticus]|uniref:Transport permease protein n=1 Tax=Terrilactibacillus laevilacticus TaxID=1380157 RepID=A0ABW5PQ76_9BACI|nr:ABC transporter permease [Terrilactibacillus laevilacticus]
MAVFANNLKRFLKHKFSLIFMIAFPIIFIAIQFSSSSNPIKPDAAFIDYDQTPFTHSLKKALQNKVNFIDVNKKSIQNKLISGDIIYAIVINKGMTESLIKNQDGHILTYHTQESNLSSGIKTFLKSYMDNAQVIAKSTEGDKSAFYQGIEKYQQSHSLLSLEKISTKGLNNSVNSIGFVIYGLFLIMNITSKLIIEDKEKGLFTRFLTTPMTLKNYNFQNILSYFLLGNIQVILLIIILRYSFHADLGPSLLNIYLVLIVFSVVSISIGTLISSFCKSSKQANSLSLLISTPVAMLGGCFWPIEIMPRFLQKIGDFLPTTWGISAVRKLIYGNDFNHVILDVSILLAFAIVFFLLSSWRRQDIAQ